MNSIGTRGQVKRNVNKYKMQLRIKLKFYVSLENIFSKLLTDYTSTILLGQTLGYLSVEFAW